MSSKYSSEDVQIILNSTPPEGCLSFLPGQTISGTVVYTPRTQVDVDNVVVNFKGKCFTQITVRRNNSTHHYREKIVLFRFEENVFRGPRTIPAARYEWPFTFTVPENVHYSRRQHSSDSMYQMGTQSLPPSFNLVAESYGHPPKASIVYNLRAKVNPGRLIHSAKRVCSLPISPVSNSPLPSLHQVSFRFTTPGGRWSSGKLRPAQLSFKEKMSHVFGSDPSLKTPEINLAITLTMPRAAGLLQKFPISLACEYTRTGETDPEAPELILDHCEIEVKSYVTCRTETTFSERVESGKESVGGMKIPGHNTRMPIDKTPVQIAEPICMQDLKGSRHTGKIVPNFRTWTMIVNYKMTVTIHIRHLETGHIFKFETKFPFEVLPVESPRLTYPPETFPVPPSEVEASSSAAPPPMFDNTPAPPSYHSKDVWQQPPPKGMLS